MCLSRSADTVGVGAVRRRKHDEIALPELHTIPIQYPFFLLEDFEGTYLLSLFLRDIVYLNNTRFLVLLLNKTALMLTSLPPPFARAYC